MCRTEDIKPVCCSEVVPTIKSVAWFSVVWGLLWHTSCHRVVPHLSVLLPRRFGCISVHPRRVLHTSFQYLQSRWQDFIVNSRAQTWSSPVLPISTFIVRLALRCNRGLQGVYNFELFFLTYIRFFWSRWHILGENKVIHCCDTIVNAFQ